MTVDTIQAGCQTTYTLRDGAGLCCVLTFSAGQGGPGEWEPGEWEPGEWEMVLPAAGGWRGGEVPRRFAGPAGVRLRAWLAPIIGAGAAELAAAVAAWPPGRQPGAAAPAGLTIPRQRDYRAA